MKAIACEGCGGKAGTKVRLTNGALYLCQQCLDDFNRKCPNCVARANAISKAGVSEREEALLLAERLLDEPNADPDDDLRMLSRQLLRREELLTQFRNLVTFIGAPEAPCKECGHKCWGGCRCECHGKRIKWFEARTIALLNSFPTTEAGAGVG